MTGQIARRKKTSKKGAKTRDFSVKTSFESMSEKLKNGWIERAYLQLCASCIPMEFHDARFAGGKGEIVVVEDDLLVRQLRE